MNEKLFTQCLRCGRKLKNPNYRKLGYGKICFNKVKKDKERPKLFEIAQGDETNE